MSERGSRKYSGIKFAHGPYLEDTPAEINDFTGNPLNIVTPETEGAEAIFWETRFIEPFIEDICVSEIHTVVADARKRKISEKAALRALRVDLIRGIIRVYWTMADIHRQILEISGLAAPRHIGRSRPNGRLPRCRDRSKAQIGRPGLILPTITRRLLPIGHPHLINRKGGA